MQQSIAEEIASNGRGRERNIRVLPMKHPRTDETFRKLSFSFWPPSNVRQLSWKGAFEKFFPCIGWISTYNYREDFQADFIAGLTVGVMLVPQAMSYAKLAGLPPIYGLSQILGLPRFLDMRFLGRHASWQWDPWLSSHC